MSIIFVVVYLFRQIESDAPLFTPKQKIVSYRIGNIDPRFNVSVEQVKFLAHEATQIWEKGTGQHLFQYDPNAELAVHLIYDERQSNSNEIDQFNKMMDQKDAELKKLNDRLESQRNTLKQREQSLERAYVKLRQERAEWSMVEFYDGENMQRIRQEEGKLDQKRHQLEQQWNAYNVNVDIYNQKIKEYNQYAQKGERHNQSSHLKTFTKGSYLGGAIEVYETSSLNDLKLTLAHEFGHALGLSHHQDPKALMYASMAEQDQDNFVLLAADLELFHKEAHRH